LIIVLIAALGWGSCLQKSGEKQPPTPKSAREPVRVGALVQLKAALDYLEMVEMSNAEPQDNLAALCHALSAFYNWPDPGDTTRARFDFIRRFCFERVGKAQCTGLRASMQQTRKMLLHDLVWASEQFLEQGQKQAGSFEIRNLLQDFKAKQKRLAGRFAALQAKWPHDALYAVPHCRTEDVQAVVLEVKKSGVWVNGVAVTRLQNGKLPQSKEVGEGLQSLLVAGSQGTRAVEASDQKNTDGDRRKGQKPVFGHMILRVEKGVRCQTVKQLLELAAAINLRWVHVRVKSKDQWPHPCWIKVFTMPHHYRFAGKGVVVNQKNIMVRASLRQANRQRADRMLKQTKTLTALCKQGACTLVFGDASLKRWINVIAVVSAALERPLAVWLGTLEQRQDSE
jgi:hypothetical protein